MLYTYLSAGLDDLSKAGKGLFRLFSPSFITIWAMLGEEKDRFRPPDLLAGSEESDLRG